MMKRIGNRQVTNVASSTRRLLVAAAVAAVVGAGSFTRATTLDLNDVDQTVSSLPGVAGDFVLNNGSLTAILTVDGSTDSTYAGVLINNDNLGTGVLGLTKSGSSVLTLSGTNTYSGGTIVTGGTLVGVNPAGTAELKAFGTGSITLNGGNLQFKDSNGGNILMGNNVVLQSTATITVGNNGGQSFGVYSLGTLAMGAQTLNLAGTNGYAASFTGTTFSGDAVLNPTVSGGGTNLRFGSMTVDDGVAGSTVTTITLGGTAGASVTGAISDNSTDGTKTLALLKNTAASWTLSGNNSFTGGITQSAGTLELNGTSTMGGTITLNGGTLIGRGTSATALPAFGNAALALNGGSLQLKGNGPSSAGTMVMNNNVTVGGTVTIDVYNNTGQINGVFSMGTLAIGANTLNITGGNNFGASFGATTLSGDAVFNPTSGKLSLGALTVADSVTTATTTTVTLGGTNGSNFVNGVISDNATDNTKILALTKSGTSTWTLLENSTYTGATLIFGGTLQVGNGGTTGSIDTTSSITNNGTLAINRSSGTNTMGMAISGTGGITKSGAGKLILSGANSYDGATSITAGVVNIQNDTALGTTVGGTTVSNNAALEIQGGITVADAINFAGNGISNTGSIRNISGDNSLTGAVVLGGNNSYIQSDAGTLTITGGINRGSGRELSLGGTGNITVEGSIDGNNVLSKTGTGTLTLKGASTFNVNFGVNAGVLNIRNNNALGTTSQGTTVSNGAALELQGNITVAGEYLSLNGYGVGGNGSLRNISGDNTWTGNIQTDSATGGRFQSDSGTLTIAGFITSSNHGAMSIGGAGNITISGSYSPQWWRFNVTKDGTGTLDLTGANYMATNTFGLGNFKDGTSTLTINAGTVSVHAGPASADAGAAWSSISKTVTVASTTGLVIGQALTGPGISAGSIITAIDSGTNTVTLSANTCFDSAASWASGATTVSVGSTVGLAVGQAVSGTGIPASTTISAIDSGTNTVTLSKTTTAASGAPGAAFSAWSSLGVAPVVLNGGTLNLNNTAFDITSLTMNAGTITPGALTNPSGTSYNVNGGRVDASLRVSGSAGLSKWNATTLTLSGSNTYTGGTAVNQGTLALDFTAVTAPTDNIINHTANSSALTLGTQPQWNYVNYWYSGSLLVTGKDGAANTQQFNGTTLTTGTFSNIAVNAGASGGTMALTLGAITRNGGATVNFATNGAGATIAASNASAAILLGGQNQAYATFNGNTWARTTGTSVVAVDAGTFYTANGATSLTTDTHIDMVSTDSNAGATTIKTLRFDENAARTLTLSGLLTLSNGAILVGSDVATAGSLITGGSITPSTSNSNNTRDLIIHQNSGQSFEIASAIVNNGVATNLSKTGTGILKLSGASTFTGSTTISAGKLQVGSTAALGSVNSQIYVNDIATLDLHGFSIGIGGLNGPGLVDNLSSTNVTLTIGNGNNGSAFPGTIQNSSTGTIAVTKLGTGNWSPFNTNTYSGGTTLSGGSTGPSGGTVMSGSTIVRGPFGTGTLTLAGGQLGIGSGITIANPIVAQASTNSLIDNEQEVTLTGTISGSGNIGSWTNNPKPLHLSGDNSGFTGIWTNSLRNTMQFDNANSGSAAAQWVFNSNVGDTAANLNFAGGTIRFGKFDGNNTFNKSGGGGTTIVEIGALNLDATYSGKITNSNGSLTIAKIGTGKQTLSGTASTYTGGTTIAAGTLAVTSNAALGANASTVTFTGNSTLQAGAAAVSLASARSLTVNTGITASIDTNGYDMTIAGAINGDGNIIKLGSGKLALSGTNVYAGTTAVNAGQVDVNGTLASPTVSVAGTGALGGSGTLAGAVTFANGGTIAPSPAATALTINNAVNFTGAMSYKWGISAAGVSSVQVKGDLTITGTPTLKLLNIDSTAPDSGTVYHLFDYTGTLSGVPASAWEIDYSGSSSGDTSHWTGGGSNGQWATGPNWDQQGWGDATVAYEGNSIVLKHVVATFSPPSPTTNVVVAPTATATIAGPTGATSIASLTLGDSNVSGYAHTLTLGNGLTTTGTVTVNPSGTLNLSKALSIPGLTSAGTTSLAADVTGTVTDVNVTAGTTTIASGATPAITTATVSGSANLTANGGAIGTLTLQPAYAGTVTVGSGASVSAPVALATGTLNLSGTLGALTVTGGAVNTGTGAAVTSAAFSAGTVNTHGTDLSVATQLAVGANLTFKSDGANAFQVRGSNLSSQVDLMTISAGATATISAAAPPPSNFVRHYTFDGTASDVNGGVGTLTNNAALGTTGAKYGSGFLDLANNGLSQLRTGTDAATAPLMPSTGWTMTAWFKQIDGTGSWRTLFRGLESLPSGAGDHPLIIENGSWKLGIYGNKSGGAFSQAGSATISAAIQSDATNWHFISAVYTGTQISYYMDGTDAGHLLGTLAKTMQDNYIGAVGNYFDNAQRFARSIDDVYMYNYALSSAQLTTVMNGNSATGINLPNTAVSIGAGGTLALDGTAAATLGDLTLQGAATLAGGTNGTPSSVTFSSVTATGVGNVPGASLNAGSTAVTIAGGSITATNAGDTLTLPDITTTGAVTIGGAGQVVTGNLDGTGALTVDGTLTAARIRQTSLAVSNGAVAKVAESSGTLASGWPGGDNAKISALTNLTLTGTAKLDLYNNDLVIDYTGDGSTLFAQINDAVSTGYAGGAWNGTGIGSTTAGQLNYFTLLVLDTADANAAYSAGGSGLTLDGSDVVVKFTHQDDFNGDGVVNATDKAIFTSHWVDNQTGATHRFGDMDFDGVYTFNDVQLFNLYYNTALPSLPEPGSLALLAIGAAGLLARKRR